MMLEKIQFRLGCQAFPFTSFCMQHRYALKTDFVLHLLAWLRLFQVLGDQVCENTIQQGILSKLNLREFVTKNMKWQFLLLELTLLSLNEPSTSRPSNP
jgi:hypothetical protein